MRTIRNVVKRCRLAVPRLSGQMALTLAVVLSLAAPVLAEEGDTPVIPDIGFDGAGMATAAGTALGSLLVVIIGIAMAFLIGRKFVRWFASYVK